MQGKLNILLENAYSPYSKINVASITVMNDDVEFNGVNVECAAYPGAICAERNSLISAIAAGYKPGQFKEINLSANTEGPLYPCGHCLQMMAELTSPEFKINIYHNGNKKTHKLSELLPFGINKESFGWK